MTSKFECPEIKKIILALGEGHTPQRCKALKNFICNKLPDGKKITKRFYKFPMKLSTNYFLFMHL